MTAAIELQELDDVPPDARVCDYDELAPVAKTWLGTLVDRDEPTAEEAVVESFGCCEVVKFTEYYEVVAH